MKNFLSNENANNHLSNDNSLLSLFKYFNNLNNLIFNIFLKRKEFLKEKLVCSLFKKNPHYDSESIENQKPNEQAMINTQSTLSTKEKIKSKPI
jgi:hypothetical protein